MRDNVTSQYVQNYFIVTGFKHFIAGKLEALLPAVFDKLRDNYLTDKID